MREVVPETLKIPAALESARQKELTCSKDQRVACLGFKFFFFNKTASSD